VTGAERKIKENIHLSHREKFDNRTSINTAFCLREAEVKKLTGDWS
jgi:hypothetical protein